jgi:CheY-like chemotaxis protein
MQLPKIVIVDDEQNIQNLLEAVLQRAGYQTLTASDGLEGMTMILKHRPNLIIMDDDMPLIQGRDLCRNLKNDPALRHIPVIMHSSHVRAYATDQEYACADALLPKPSVPRDILSKVRGLLDDQIN